LSLGRRQVSPGLRATTTLKLCAIMSCSSRAMRSRSAVIAAY